MVHCRRSHEWGEETTSRLTSRHLDRLSGVYYLIHTRGRQCTSGTLYDHTPNYKSRATRAQWSRVVELGIAVKKAKKGVSMKGEIARCVQFRIHYCHHLRVLCMSLCLSMLLSRLIHRRHRYSCCLSCLLCMSAIFISSTVTTI